MSLTDWLRPWPSPHYHLCPCLSLTSVSLSSFLFPFFSQLYNKLQPGVMRWKYSHHWFQDRKSLKAYWKCMCTYILINSSAGHCLLVSPCTLNLKNCIFRDCVSVNVYYMAPSSQKHRFLSEMASCTLKALNMITFETPLTAHIFHIHFSSSLCWSF